MAVLAKKKEALQKICDYLNSLRSQFDEAMAKKNDLQNQVTLCGQRLERAQKLINGLGGEHQFWQSKSNKFAQDIQTLLGDIILSSGVIAYLGVYTTSYRNDITQEWSKYLNEKLNIACAKNFSLIDVLGDKILTRDWILNKLPKDEFSISNAIIFTKSIRYPLFIDPQGQSNRWIKNMERKNDLQCVKMEDQHCARVLQNSIQFGMRNKININNLFICLFIYLHFVSKMSLTLELTVIGNRKVIKLGEQAIDFNERFQLYLTTKLASPHYTPSVSTKVVLINFAITLEGLDDQMLAIVVGKDEKEMEVKREQLIIEQHVHNQQLQGLESQILQSLSEATGNILDDQVLIDTLQKSKEASKNIEKRMNEAKVVEEQIEAVRRQYKSLSRSTANLFFSVSDLSVIDPMYQFSLSWFLSLFEKAIENSDIPKDKKDKSKRTKAIDKECKESLYRNVCRSLFEQHKLWTSNSGDFFLTGGGLLNSDENGNVANKPNPCPDWLDERMWGEIRNLSSLGGIFSTLDQDLTNNGNSRNVRAPWKVFFDNASPTQLYHYLPKEWATKLSPFEKLCLLRCLRMDLLLPAIQSFVKQSIGEYFIRPPTFDLDGVYKDSSVHTPIIFILSPGSDPMNELLKLASKYGMNGKDKLFSISLGQGQGPIAKEGIEEAIDKGNWVVLQNCHLAPSWMPQLQKIVEEIERTKDKDNKDGSNNNNNNNKDRDNNSGNDPLAFQSVENDKTTYTNINPHFRLWLASMPFPQFPLSILQNGIKVTNDPPKGMQANLKKTFQSLDESWFESSQRPFEFKKLMFALAFFHGVVQERRKFGPLGWNIPYAFSDSDFRISSSQLHMILQDLSISMSANTNTTNTNNNNDGSNSNLNGNANQKLDDEDLMDGTNSTMNETGGSDIPFKQLKYMIGELNYGGRVTDDRDRLTLMTLLGQYFTPMLVNYHSTYNFSESSKYYAPEEGDVHHYLSYIQSLPLMDEPEVFGLHPNASISSAIQEANDLIHFVSRMQAKDMQSNVHQSRTQQTNVSTQDQIMAKVCDDILTKLPPNYDLCQVQLKYPVSYQNSMNTVLVQELTRFNRSSLIELKRATAGEVVMSNELEQLQNAITNVKVPEMWSNVAMHPSNHLVLFFFFFLLSILLFILITRFFQQWIDNGEPSIFWISGFFFTQSFLTGCLQNFARKYAIPIDELQFEFIVQNNMVELMSDNMPFVDKLHLIQANPQLNQRPKDGCFIFGLYLDGAGWDLANGVLCEQKPKQLFSSMPVIWLKPIRTADFKRVCFCFFLKKTKNVRFYDL
ncbi:dynein heavy chain [Reticulomyxa filosa]|uniref:Dynein heavy chain n=1 Tax=Reticulomyxa filosa TaxID=46433 RepID=X6MXX3_RETFI|nr:dynein heavy chain [Reticulomyxa filosa]|eukprot:ETO18471.1 dynein heavy chain [Reticulomyxa filosa]